MSDPLALCPCGAAAYLQCCAPYHQGEAFPLRAEQLMRSRYSAYALNLNDYIWETTHPKKRSRQLQQSLTQESPLTWLRLEILETSLGAEQDKQGKVRFKAHFEQEQQRGVLHEHSRFRRYQKRWYYWDGTFLES